MAINTEVTMQSLRRITALFVAVTALGAAGARAEVHLTVEASTDFPLDLAGKVLLELPGRVRLNASVGFMPSAYATGYTGFAKLFTKYESDTADVIKSGIQSSWV